MGDRHLHWHISGVDTTLVFLGGIWSFSGRIASQLRRSPAMLEYKVIMDNMPD